LQARRERPEKKWALANEIFKYKNSCPATFFTVNGDGKKEEQRLSHIYGANTGTKLEMKIGWCKPIVDARPF
jgi:hypothetical protein